MECFDIFEISKKQTRIAILSKEKGLAKKFLSIAELQGKEMDFFIENKRKIGENDFFIFETHNLQEAASFQPNIVMIGSGFSENFAPLLFNTVQGGIVIYPENIELPVVENYFRKLTFEAKIQEKESENFHIETDYGVLPLNSNSRVFVENIDGLKLLCQQIGIMEEDFYEVLMTI